MTRITSLDLQPFFRQSIGLDRVFDRFITQIDQSQPSGYPPYNIIKTGEEASLVQVAVAGFTDGELGVEVRDNTLYISGEKTSSETEEVNPDWQYTHQGISNRRFVRTFPLADYVEVLSATVENGILTVSLERKVPDTMKPKSIEITYKK